MLEEIKKALGIVGKYQDDTIKLHITEVKRFMQDGGVAKSVIESPETYGVIKTGVADLWNNGSGNTTLSQHFIDSVVQLALKREAGNEELQADT